MNESRYLSRKFILSALVIVSATGLLATAFLDGTQWVTAVGGALAVYSLANVAQKATEK